MSASLDVQLCSTMCEMGCSQADCYCDSFDHDHTPDNAVCGAESALVAACHENTGCAGLVYDHDTSQAEFFASAVTADEKFAAVGKRLWSKETGAACTQIEDYTETVGVLTVTTQVYTGVDYVVTPGQQVSLEVTNVNGNYLTFDAHDKDWDTAGSRDVGASWNRVMVIDCKGQCGQAGPSGNVQINGAGASLSDWAIHSPTNFWSDSIYGTNDAGTRSYISRAYATFAGMHCERSTTSNNLNILATGLEAAEAVLCTTVCQSGDGHESCHLQHVDPSGNAICASADGASTSLEVVQSLCDQIDAMDGFYCDSVEQHLGATDYFYLNGGADGDALCDKVAAANYNLYVASDDTAESSGAQLVQVDEEVILTANLNDWPFSWSQMLRFPSLTFTTGGTFKVCYCEHDRASNKLCNSVDDFDVEVGLVHSSGVSCLLTDSRFTSADCENQLYGGMRCYAGAIDTPDHLVAPTRTRSVFELLKEDINPQWIDVEACSSAGGAHSTETGSVLGCHWLQ